MKHQFPASWSIKSFKDVAEVITGTTPSTQCPEYYGGSVPFVGPAELGRAEPITQSSKWLSFAGAKQARLLPAESVLICCIGATIGKVGFSGVELATNQQINALVFDKNVVHPKYAFHYCHTLKSLIWHMGASTTLPILPKGRFQKIEIPLPPLEEQRRIAAILDKADAVRRKRQSAIALTEELLRSAFLEMFGDPVTNPKGWETVQMSQVVSQTQYGTAEKANSEKNGIPVLRMNNITYTGEFKLDDLKWCPILPADEAKFTVRRGDLLFNRTNSPELVGKTAVWRSDEKYAFAGYLVRVRFKADQALSEYISAYLNSSHGKKYLLERAKPSINMSNFSASEFLKIPILLPPLALQERFVVIADATRSHISRFEGMVKDANDLFNSLLQKAFRGQL